MPCAKAVSARPTGEEASHGQRRAAPQLLRPAQQRRHRVHARGGRRHARRLAAGHPRHRMGRLRAAAGGAGLGPLRGAGGSHHRRRQGDSLEQGAGHPEPGGRHRLGNPGPRRPGGGQGHRPVAPGRHPFPLQQGRERGRPPGPDRPCRAAVGRSRGPRNGPARGDHPRGAATGRRRTVAVPRPCAAPGQRAAHPQRAAAAEAAGAGRVPLQEPAVPLQPGADPAGAEHVAAAGEGRRHLPGGNPPPAAQRGGNPR
ncbi:hypothetical protein D9M68_561610 [compost metagenome]